MPSPIDNTVPTSATSASLPKPAICCLRISEISDARISIKTSSETSLRQPRKYRHPRESGGPGPASPVPATSGFPLSRERRNGHMHLDQHDHQAMLFIASCSRCSLLLIDP